MIIGVYVAVVYFDEMEAVLVDLDVHEMSM